jgi:hypothetical protein
MDTITDTPTPTTQGGFIRSTGDLMAVMVCALALVAMGAFVVYWVISTLARALDTDDLAIMLSVLSCGGLMALLLVGFFVWRFVSGSWVESTERATQSLMDRMDKKDDVITASIQAIQQQNAVLAGYLMGRDTRPAPGAISAPAVSTQHLPPPPIVINSPERRRPWMYPIVRDGRNQYVRGDLIQHYVRWGFSDRLPESQRAFRDYVRARYPDVEFDNGQQSLIKAALVHEGALVGGDRWAGDEDAIMKIVTVMRERSWQP